MYDDYVDYTSGPNTQIVDQLTQEEIQKRFDIVQPLFEQAISEFNEEFSNKTEILVERIMAKKEVEIDALIAKSSLSIDEIKDQYFDDSYAEKIFEEFEDAAQRIYSSMFVKYEVLNEERIKEAHKDKQEFTEEQADAVISNFKQYLANELNEQPGSPPYAPCLDSIVAPPVPHLLVMI